MNSSVDIPRQNMIRNRIAAVLAVVWGELVLPLLVIGLSLMIAL
jgi:hypothetical protein